jgi:hypothetical protein
MTTPITRSGLPSAPLLTFHCECSRPHRAEELLAHRRLVLWRQVVPSLLEIGRPVFHRQAPEAVHVGVPAALHRAWVAFVDAEPTELLHDVEHLGEPFGAQRFAAVEQRQPGGGTDRAR